jgi:heat shock protein HslJ
MRLIACVLALALAGAAAAQEVPRQPPAMTPGDGAVSPGLKGPPRIGDELVLTSWQAQTVAGTPAIANSGLTLEFLEDGFVRGDTGCNRFVGPFASRADRVSLGPLSTTRNDCALASLGRQEVAYINALQRAERMQVQEAGSVLLIFSKGAKQPSRFLRLP